MMDYPSELIPFYPGAGCFFWGQRRRGEDAELHHVQGRD